MAPNRGGATAVSDTSAEPSPSMRRALALAREANFGTSPNPMVGAVLVRDGVVLGEARHARAGEAHAEVLALRAAGGRAEGATLYVTLEPCAHEGRQGPCAAAFAEAGVSRVVASMEDPDPRVQGRGLEWLRRAGVEVEVGDGAAGAEELNRRWLATRREHRAFCGLKFAMSLDGKIATASRQSRWITGEAARAEAHRLRGAYAAVAVGARTVADDDPRLTARDGEAEAGRQPLRVVVDGRLGIDPAARILDPAGGAPALVVAGRAAVAARGEALREAGARVEALGDGERVDLRDLLRLLHDEGADSLLIEGGGELAWSAVAAGVVDHVYAFVAPLLIGGATTPTPVGGDGFADLAAALRLEIVEARRLGEDILVEAVPR